MPENRPKYPREKALAVAEEIYQRLLPFCDKLKVAGSLRRYRKFVSDIEFVLIPKVQMIPEDLFGKATAIDQSTQWFEAMLIEGYLKKRGNKAGIPAWGPKNKLAIHVASGIPIDFFTTTPENWWVTLVIRTGGVRTNLELTMSANKKGMRLNAYGSGFTTLKGVHIPCGSEESVFKTAGVPFVEPQYRK